MGDQVSRDRLYVVMDFRRKDITHPLQDVFGIARPHMEASMEQAPGQGTNFEWTLEHRKFEPNSLRQNARIGAVRPFE